MNHITFLLSFAGSPAQCFFKDRGSLDGVRYAILARDLAFAISICHPEMDENGNIKVWQTLIVADIGESAPPSLQGGYNNMQPVFVLSGQITEDGENFLIRDMICRLPTDEQDTLVNWAVPADQNDARAMLLYGYRALTDLIQSNEPLDLEALETTLNPTQCELDEEFQKICQPSPPSIPYIDLCRAFQIGNDDYYTSTNSDLGGYNVAFSARIFTMLNMSAGLHFNPEESPVLNVATHIHCNEHNQYAFIFEYALPLNDGESTHNLCALFFQTILNEQGQPEDTRVYGAFEGSVIGDQFIPTKILFKPSEGSPTQPINLNIPRAVHAAFWFMDGVFTLILANRDVELSKLAERLSPEQKAATTTALGIIFNRSADDLRKSIDLLEVKPHPTTPGALEKVGGRKFLTPKNPNAPWIEMRKTLN